VSVTLVCGSVECFLKIAKSVQLHTSVSRDNNNKNVDHSSTDRLRRLDESVTVNLTSFSPKQMERNSGNADGNNTKPQAWSCNNGSEW